MELKLSEEQRMLVASVRRFVREEIVPLEADLDPDAYQLPKAERQRLTAMTKAMGLFQMDVPMEFGGPGLDLTTQAVLTEEMSQHRAGLYASCYDVFGTVPPPSSTPGPINRRNSTSIPCYGARRPASSA